jgi:hypothetical protein
VKFDSSSGNLTTKKWISLVLQDRHTENSLPPVLRDADTGIEQQSVEKLSTGPSLMTQSTRPDPGLTTY